VKLRLPPLREELALREGPRAHDGQPGWILHDPSRNRFFRLDWLTFEIVQRWSLRDPAQIARHITEHTPLQAGVGDVEAVLKFLAQHQLLNMAGAHLSPEWTALHEKATQGGWRWWVMNYLFFRIPLVRPERLLVWMERRMQFLFRPWFWRLTALAAIAGLAMIWRQWDAFRANWSDLADFSGLLGFLAVIVGVKVFHEFGHGLAATHFGCRVPAMGVAFLVLTPVAYTDVNEAWNLKERRPRLWIGAAGMITELMLAAWSTLAWGLLPDGPLRSIAFILATTTWVKSLLINVSPVMRFDGYYLLSDALDLPNLHTRCFALSRWWLREVLFGLKEQPPERFSRKMQRGLVALGIFIWLYRLVVFLGIAVFIYYFFFKALGIVLFTVEIIWFVLLPIGSEMKVWFEKRRAILRSKRTRWTAAVAAVLVLLAAVPLPQRVRLQGEFGPAAELSLLAPDSARLVQLPVENGARVAAGQVLLRMDSPAARQRLERARLREARIVAEMSSVALDGSCAPADDRGRLGHGARDVARGGGQPAAA
jgi:putative peptide zinc metalloprotease protein